MKSILVSFLIGLLCLTTACKNKIDNGYAPPVFPDISEAQVTVIGDTDIIYPCTSHILVTDSNIAVLGLLDDYWMQVYDRFSGQPKSQHVRIGNGPEELARRPNGGLYFHNDTVKAYDYNADKVKIYDKKWNYLAYDTVRPSNILALSDVYPLPDDKYVFTCATEDRVDALGIIQNGKEGSLYTVTPVDDEDDGPVDIIKLKEGHVPSKSQMYQRNNIAVSPDGTKLVATTIRGVYMEIFDIDGLNLVPKKTLRMYPYEVQNQDYLFSETDDTVQGFTAVCVTDDRIIGALLESPDITHPTDITVWDWMGNPIRRYKTDYIIGAMAVSPDNPEDIYAIVCSPETDPQLLLFHCPALQD